MVLLSKSKLYRGKKGISAPPESTSNSKTHLKVHNIKSDRTVKSQEKKTKFKGNCTFFMYVYALKKFGIMYSLQDFFYELIY
jgi:hypothetical protein